MEMIKSYKMQQTTQGLFFFLFTVPMYNFVNLLKHTFLRRIELNVL
jgi:hypothetical protein